MFFLIPKLFFSLEKNDSLPVYFSSATESEKNIIDTSLTQFQDYTPRNTLGNTGLAQNPLTIIIPERALGFQYSTNYFESYLFDKNNRRYFFTYKPYTDVTLFLGQKKEQVFRLVHTQNISKRLNLSVEFNRTRTEGWYSRQNVNHNNLSLSSNYVNKKNNYSLFFSGMYNKLQSAENGGIRNDTIFEEVDLTDKKLIRVNLSSAQRRISNSEVFAKQNFYFGRRSNDSLKIVYRSSCFSHIVNFENNKWVYEDKDSSTFDFYNAILEDSVTTLDSIQYYSLENSFAFELLSKNRSKEDRMLKGAAFVTHQYIDLSSRNGRMDSVMNNFIAGIKIDNKTRNRNVGFLFEGDYLLSGVNSNDYKSKLSINIGSNDSTGVFSIFANVDNRTPDLIYGKYCSNHFAWNNKFNKVFMASQSISYVNKKYKLECAATLYQFTNYLYFDNYSMPRQLDGSLSMFSAFLRKDFKLKNWHLCNKVIYQYVPDSTVLRFPAVITKHSLYYENNLFKKALSIQVGADIFYYSSYMANIYMPALSQYYIQNEKRIGNYPFVDVFLNMKIKSARVFVKMEHVNSGLMGRTYYAVPHQPYTDRVFKIGINWKFYD